MLSRLVDLDLTRVFDLDSTGFIDTGVLARSLKVWDSAVFTDETVDDFFRWANLEKGHGSGVNIQEIVGFVKSMAPKLPKLKRRTLSRESRASAASDIGSEACSFSAEPRSCKTREPLDEGSKNRSGRAPSRQKAPGGASSWEPSRQEWNAAWQDAEEEVRRKEASALSSAAEASTPASVTPPSPRTVNRLAYMDILRVLDVEGNGLINREVLKKSLQVFDPDVFNERSVERLIHAATRGKRGPDDSMVKIVDLALFMGAPVFLSITPKSVEASQEEASVPTPPGEEPALRRQNATPPAEESGGDPADMAEVAEEPKAKPEPAQERQERSVEVPVIQQVAAPLEMAEEFLLAALEQSDVESSCGALMTARTDVESTVNDIADAWVAIEDLRDGACGCEIPNAEMRGITLRQLRRIMHYIEEHCERESWYDPETGAPLTPDKVDLFCLMEWVVRPATKNHKCSFVELIADCASKQRPQWYVSHGTGPVAEFFDCLVEHAHRHGFSDDAAYWVETYAKDPWKAQQGDCVWEKALAVSQGTVQVIGKGPVAYLEVGSHSLLDTDTEPFYGVRPFRN